MADNIEPTTHLEKVIAGQESPITHLEKVIALYGGSGGSGVGSEALEELDNKIEALKSTQSIEYGGKNITCRNTLASRTSDMLIKGQTYQNLFRRINSQTTQEQDNNYILTGVANVYSMLSIYPAYNLQKNNKYTAIIDVKNINTTDGKPFKFDGFNGNAWVCGTKITTTGLQKIPLQGTQDITEIRLQINNGVNCNITISKNIIILKGDWTKKEVPSSITGIESAGQKENKINILSNNNKLVDDIDYKEDKKEILLPIQGGLKSLPNGVYDTIEQKADGIYLVQRVKKETYVNGDENNNNYLTDKVNTYKPLEAPVETKLDIQNLDLEVYKDVTYVTTDNAIQPTLSFKAPSNMGGVMHGNAQNINKLYKLVDDTQVKKDIADLDTNKQDKTDNALDTTDKTVVGAINEIYDGLLDNVTFSADYKNIIINRKGGTNPYTIPIASIIHNAKLTELNDIDSTNIANGKILVYDNATKKHKYVGAKLTDEFVKMDSTTGAKHLAELIDKNTVINDNGVLKVKKLDGQEVTITEINYLKGLTMNIVDLVKSFASGGVKMYEHTIATYADLLALDRSNFVDGVRYFVYVQSDETHGGIKTTYICDKENTDYFGVSGDHRDFTAEPIDLANEVTGKLGTSNIDVDALWKLLTINDTYKTLTTKNEVFGTHGAKALYDELVADLGEKANTTDLETHKNDTNIHITTAERTKWNDKLGRTDIATTIDENSTDEKPAGARAVYEKIKNMVTASVPDVSKTNITSKVSNATVNSNGGVYYSVKNGICYVQFTSVTTTTATNGRYIVPQGTLPSIDNNLSNGRYPVVGGGATVGMVAVDGNTGGIKYFGGEMNIFTTISYPVAEQ